MKVLFLIDTLQTGGAEKSLLEIAKRLKNFTPVMVTLFSKKPDLLNDYQQAGIKVINLNIDHRDKLWWSRGAKLFAELVNKEQPDIIHAHLYKSEIVARLARKNYKALLIGAFVNDSYVKERYEQQSFFQNCKLNIVRYIDAVTARHVDFFTSITHTIAKSNSKKLHIPLEKIKTIYRGRDIRSFQPEATTRENKFVFLTVARLLRRKGYLELIEAAAKLNACTSSFEIWIAGEGHDRKLFENKVQELRLEDKVLFLGNRSDVPVLLSKANCFVFPSHYEGAGGALIEAMLSAKPIVASDIQVFQEQIQDNRTGLLFALSNTDDLKTKMEWVMNNYEAAKLLGINAKQYAIKEYDIDVIASKYDEFYKEMLKR